MLNSSTPLPTKVFSNPIKYGLTLTDTGLLGYLISLAYEGIHTESEIIELCLKARSDEPISEIRIRQIIKQMENENIFKLVKQSDGTVKLIYPDFV